MICLCAVDNIVHGRQISTDGCSGRPAQQILRVGFAAADIQHPPRQGSCGRRRTVFRGERVGTPRFWTPICTSFGSKPFQICVEVRPLPLGIGLFSIGVAVPCRNNGYIESFNNRLRKECLNRNHWTFLYFTSAVPPAPTFVSVSRPSDNHILRRRFHACHRGGRNRSRLSAPRSYRENRVVRCVAFRSGGNGGLGGRRQ
jgi:hypothetical protein